MYDWTRRGYTASYSRKAVLNGLLVKVFFFLAVSMVFTAAGGLVGATGGWGLCWTGLVAFLVCGFAVTFLREVPVVNLGLMYGMAFCLGIPLGWLVELYARLGRAHVVYEVAILTAVLTAGLATYGLTTRRDFSGMGYYLFVALLGFTAATVASIFLRVALLDTLLGAFGAVLFSIFVVYDVNRARKMPNTVGNAVILAVSVYLDIMNLFLSLLRLLRR